MYKKLTILFLLLTAAKVMGVGGNDSVLGKRSAETDLPDQPPLKQSYPISAEDKILALNQDKFIECAASTSLVEIAVDEISRDTKYFCSDCFVDFQWLSSAARLKHAPSCLFKNYTLLPVNIIEINRPSLVYHTSGEIYYLSPTRGAIYLENARLLDLTMFTSTPDNQFACQDRLWDRYGFELDVATGKRKSNNYDDEFQIKNVRPRDTIKTNFSCSACSATLIHEEYFEYVHHLKGHEVAKPHICRYADCANSFKRERELVRHENTFHSGIEYCCPNCTLSFSRKDDLKHRHIKKYHPEHYAQYKK